MQTPLGGQGVGSLGKDRSVADLNRPAKREESRRGKKSGRKAKRERANEIGIESVTWQVTGDITCQVPSRKGKKVTPFRQWSDQRLAQRRRGSKPGIDFGKVAAVCERLWIRSDERVRE